MKKRVPYPECPVCGWKGELIVEVTTRIDHAAFAMAGEQRGQPPVALLDEPAGQCVVFWKCPGCGRSIQEHMNAGLLEDVREG